MNEMHQKHPRRIAATAPLDRRANLVVVIAVVAMLLIAGDPANAAPGSFRCTTPGALQNEVDTAPTGATIVLDPGVCFENLTITRDLVLIGSGSGVTTIDGSTEQRSVIQVSGGATLTMRDLSIRNGTALAGVWPDTGSGGGILVRGSNLTLERVEVTDNSAVVSGGGIALEGGTVNIHESNIHDNRVTQPGGSEVPQGGGGISAVFGATLTITESAITNNQALGPDISGGGIYSGSQLTIINTTIANNVSTAGGGGLINVLPATITNSTLAGNTALGAEGGGGILNVGDGLKIETTIVAGNSSTVGPDCRVTGAGQPIESSGNNLVGDATGCTLALVTTDLAGSASSPVDPLLATVEDNGGPTPTMAIDGASPAIDHIPVTSCPTEIDQRLHRRPVGEGCDIGAYERDEYTVGLFDPTTASWQLMMQDSPGLQSFYYGDPGDTPFVGDWDCDGNETPGLFRTSDAFVYLRNSNTQGLADIRFLFGDPSDVSLAGDFNGDGCDTISIYRPSEARFYVMNRLGANGEGLGAADYSFLFGNPGDEPVVGDWDGDGDDEIGLYRESTGLFYWRNTLDTGVADGSIFFGEPGDRFVAGDWGIVDGKDTPGVFRSSNTVFYFRYTLTQGNADTQFAWTDAGASWLPIAGAFRND